MTGFIDWTEEKLSLYVFEKKGNQYTIVDTQSVSLEGELNQASLTPFIKANIKQIYLSVPVNLFSLRELSFPFSDRTKIKDTISYELEGIVLGNISDYSIDYIIKESSESGSQVLAVCMEKTKLRDIIDIFSSVGLEPVSITSIDLRFSSKNIEILFESPAMGEEIRVEAAREELVNPLINLRQGELAYKGDIDRIKRSLRFTGTLVVVLLLILGFDLTLNLITLKKENTLLAKEVNSTYYKVFPEDTKLVDAVRQFKGTFNALMEKKTVLGGTPVLDIMLDIANLKNKNITLEEFSASDKNILIKGMATSFENVDSFKNALSNSFAEVKVIGSKASPDKKIRFSIIMKEKIL